MRKIRPELISKADLVSFGRNRAVVKRNYAFIPPEGILESRLPAYEKTIVYFQTAPVMGARFAQAILEITPTGGTRKPISDRLQHFFLVLSGEIELSLGNDSAQSLSAGAYVYLPPNLQFALRNNGSAPVRLLTLKCPYQAIEDFPAPDCIVSHMDNAKRIHVAENPGLIRQSLLPIGDMCFDMEMNVLSFAPGTTFPAVETHIMEHGLYMLRGQGLYLLGNDWHDIRAEDFIWMGSYVPQLFCSSGTEEAAYLLYKDVNRDVSFKTIDPSA